MSRITLAESFSIIIFGLAKTNDAKLPPSILEAKNKYIAQLTTHENAAIEQQHRDQIAEEPERATPEYIDMLMREHGFKR